MVGSGKVVPFITRSQKLAEEIMRIYKMSDSIIDSFKQGEVRRSIYVHYNKIIQSVATEADQEIIFDLLKQGELVYHILLAYDMQGKQLNLGGDYPSYIFEKLISKICYLCVPVDLNEVACSIEGIEGETRLETTQNYIDDVLFEARQGVLRAYVTDDFHETLTFNQIEVTVIRGDLVLVT